MNSETLRAMRFPAAVAIVVAMAVWQPSLFGIYGSFDLKLLIVPLIQVIMFGMGATLSVADFVRVAQMPRPILVGFALQFTVMPLIAWVLAWSFDFEPEVAAGLILIGSVAGGVASNVVTYLAGGNVPLSVTLTLCSTLASPVATPLLMKVLAGRLVPIDVGTMMLSIANMILLPVAVGLVVNRVLYGQVRWNRTSRSLLTISGLAAAMIIGLALLPSSGPGVIGEMRLGLILGFTFLSLMAALKWLLNVRLGRTDPWLDRALPVVSMFSICFIIGIITSRAREQLLNVGIALLCAAILHNLAGYVLGFWGARAAGLEERDCRTVAIEVGMQNGGMASGIAMNVLHSAGAGLAAAVFGPWMNISGALLAGWWKRRPLPPPASSSIRNAATEPSRPHSGSGAGMVSHPLGSFAGHIRPATLLLRVLLPMGVLLAVMIGVVHGYTYWMATSVKIPGPPTKIEYAAIALKVLKFGSLACLVPGLAALLKVRLHPPDPKGETLAGLWSSISAFEQSLKGDRTLWLVKLPYLAPRLALSFLWELVGLTLVWVIRFVSGTIFLGIRVVGSLRRFLPK